MTDAEILQLLIYCTTTARAQGYKLVGGKPNITWSDSENKWVSKNLTCSCLSAILLIGQRTPDVILKRSDDLAIATLAKLIDKSASWIESFMDAYDGQPNSHASISGHVMGFNIRRHFPPNKD